MTDPVKALITEQIENPDTQWSVGTFGGIAEFSRDVDEHVSHVATAEGVSAFTKRGGIAIQFRDAIRPFASESITKLGWSHRVALCLPEIVCAMNQRAVLTELGSDAEALRDEDRHGVLFDLGLDALQADLCIRISDMEAVKRLREHTGRSLFEAGNPAMGVIFTINPHRVFVSRIGRVEVYQPIPAATGRSPDGPHTHVLPKLLKSRRTHPATEPVPEGWVPCAHLYPAHPAKDAFGVAISFARTHHDAFQTLVEQWGSTEIRDLKKRIVAAVEAGQSPKPDDVLDSREGRTALRVALRQLKAQGHTGPSLPAWVDMFDPGDSADDSEDDAAKQHGH